MGELEPAQAYGGLHGAVRIARAIPLGRRRPLGAAAAAGLGLCRLQGCLEHACRGQPDPCTHELCATLPVALALQPWCQLWCFLLARRSRPCPTGGSFFLVMPRSHLTLTVPEKGRSS